MTHKRKLVLGVPGIMVVIGAITAAVALGDPGELDESFGDGGRVMTPVNLPGQWSQVRVRVAEDPDGKIVVAGAGRLDRYLENGELDQSFGNGGMTKIPLPGRLRFTLGDIDVDGEGRIVLIGTATRPNSARIGLAAVVRYGVDGRLDPTFSNDGILVSGFGLTKAQARVAPPVTAKLGAIDDKGEITLIAGTVGPVSRCGEPTRIGARDQLVVRLAADGALDPAFGRGGVQRITSLESVAGMAFDEQGDLVLAGDPQTNCGPKPVFGLIRFREDGSRDQRFGEHGISTFTSSVAAIAIDELRRIVVLCQSRRLPSPHGDESITKVMRLLPNGHLDPSFSGGWIVYVFQGPLYKWRALTLDSGRRPLLVGTLIRPPSAKSDRFHRWFMVVRLRESGQLGNIGGFRGWIAIRRFGPDSDAAVGDALLDDQGRLLIAGTIARTGRGAMRGFALARFELTATRLLRAAGLRRRASAGGPP